MAKKAMGKVQQGAKSRMRAEVIIPQKSEKGSYTFTRLVVASEQVKDLIAPHKK